MNKKNITSTWRDVVNDGFRLEGVNYKADALFLDVPNPWAAIHHVKQTLKRRTYLFIIKMVNSAVSHRVSSKWLKLAMSSENKSSRTYKPYSA